MRAAPRNGKRKKGNAALLYLGGTTQRGQPRGRSIRMLQHHAKRAKPWCDVFALSARTTDDSVTIAPGLPPFEHMVLTTCLVQVTTRT